MDYEKTLLDAHAWAIDHYYRKTAGLGGNVVGVGIGHRNGDPKNKLSVRVCVVRRLDQGSVRPDDLIKKDFDVVQTGRFISYQGIAGPGSSLGLKYSAPNIDPALAGRLSAVVQFGGKYYVLGTNHVLAVNGRVPLGKEIFFRPPDQFVDDPDQYIIAKLSGFVELHREEANSVDCAIAEIVDPDKVTDKFPDSVVSYTDLGEAEPGMEVVAAGQTVGPSGRIVSAKQQTSVDYTFGTFDFVEQMSIVSDGNSSANGEMFARPGDSGAVVVDVKSKKAVGLVVAGSGTHTIACSLRSVFDRLETKLPREKSSSPASGAASFQQLPKERLQLTLGKLGAHNEP